MYEPCIPGFICECGHSQGRTTIAQASAEQVIQDACSHAIKDSTTIKLQAILQRRQFAKEIVDAISKETFESSFGEAVLLSKVERIIISKI